MAKIYYRKIKDGEINTSTGEAWKIEDVPVRWRDAVQALIDGDKHELV